MHSQSTLTFPHWATGEFYVRCCRSHCCFMCTHSTKCKCILVGCVFCSMNCSHTKCETTKSEKKKKRIMFRFVTARAHSLHHRPCAHGSKRIEYIRVSWHQTFLCVTTIACVCLCYGCCCMRVEHSTNERESMWMCVLNENKFANEKLNDLAASFQTRIGSKGECSSLDS